MKIEHTSDSPILLKMIPETPLDIFKNSVMAKAFSRMEIPYEVRDNGILILSIDPCGWEDFAEHKSKEQEGI